MWLPCLIAFVCFFFFFARDSCWVWQTKYHHVEHKSQIDWSTCQKVHALNFILFCMMRKEKYLYRVYKMDAALHTYYTGIGVTTFLPTATKMFFFLSLTHRKCIKKMYWNLDIAFLGSYLFTLRIYAVHTFLSVYQFFFRAFGIISQKIRIHLFDLCYLATFGMLSREKIITTIKSRMGSNVVVYSNTRLLG